jgi:hypothetical protein
MLGSCTGATAPPVAPPNLSPARTPTSVALTEMTAVAAMMTTPPISVA